MIPLTNMDAQTVNLGDGEGFVGVYTALLLMIDTDAALRAKVEGLEKNCEFYVRQNLALLDKWGEGYTATVEAKLADAQGRVKELENLQGVPQCWKVEHMNHDALTTRLTQAEHDAKGARECNQRQAEEITELRRDRTKLEEALKSAPTGVYGETHGDVIARYYAWYEGERQQALHPAQEEI